MYQALYRKWRPKTFDDVVGQEHISETLKNQIVTGRLSHAYLFVGTRGTGKTTCAKILARAVNCRDPQNGNPCNKCPSCLGIDDGSILDVLELDAASNNGVDNVRMLREEAVFTPVDVKKRVYIIDEVHMLSTPAFNALLKILEEPPEHLIFILATTEIHKVPATILSRCQRYTFKRIQPEKIADRLLDVAGREGFTLTAGASRLLARLSDGSMRDALSLLDQCASGDAVDEARVHSAIGLAENDEIARILTAVADSDISGALDVLDKLYMGGKVMGSVIESLMNLVRDLLVLSLMPGGGTGLLSGGFDPALLETLKKRFNASQLMTIMDILRDTMQDISKSGGGKLSAELCLMRLCTQNSNGGLSGDALAPILARLSALEERLNGGAAGGIAGFTARPSGPGAFTAPKTEPCVPDKPFVAPSGTGNENKPVAAERELNPEPQPDSSRRDDQPPAPEQPDQRGAVPGPAAPAVSGEAWNAMLKLIQPKIDIPPFMFLSDPAQVTAQIEGNAVTIKVKTDFTAMIINVPAVTSALKEAAAAVLKVPTAVRVVVDGASSNSGGSKLDVLKDRFPGIIKEEE